MDELEKQLAELRKLGATQQEIDAYVAEHRPGAATSSPGQQFGALVANGATLNFAPKILGAIDAANKMLPSALGGEGAPLADFGKNYASTRDRISHAADEGVREHPIAGRAAEFAGGALTALPMAAERAAANAGMKILAQPLATRVAKSAAVGAGVGATAGAGAATGGIEDYAGAMVKGGAAGAVLGAAAPPIASALGKGASSTLTTLGLRPGGRTAEEIAADAATMKAPTGPQAAASNTPLMREAVNNVPSQPPGATPQPSMLDQWRATTGRAVQNLGVESNADRGLRLTADRFGLDNVTPEDAAAYVDRAGGKPVSVMDLGGGNVAGLARLAKDTPGLGRKLIPDFLHGRSSGTFGDEGQTLQRITGDVEQRIGLAPENYYATLEDMTRGMKNRASSDYGAIRNTVVDDPEVISLFDDPEWRAVHERIRANARVGRKDVIPPLSTEGDPLAMAADDVGSGVVQNPQKLGTLDLMKRQLDKIITGKADAVGPVDRDMARQMRDRLHDVLDRMDELHPEYKNARATYRGSAEAIDAYQQGKDEFMNLDPRAIAQQITKMPERLQDLYRRGGYDALRTRLSKMDDGANVGAFLEKNPDIRDRVAALAKTPDDASALRGDLSVERAMGDRKNFVLGGPNTAERLIEDKATQPSVTAIGNAVRQVPGVGKLAGGLVDNAVTRRSADQTSAIMGEVAKIMTRTGKAGVQQTFDEIERLKASEALKLLTNDAVRARAAGVAGGRTTRR